MFEQDYVMRLIKEMVRSMLKLLFNVDTDSPTADLLSESEQKETLDELLDMIDTGNINEAENRLYDLESNGVSLKPELALLFYSYLNEKEDGFLEEHNYSREEIRLGLKAVAADYGLSNVVEIFLEE